MSIFRSNAIGGVVSALDSDSISNELSIVDPTFGNLLVGSKVWNIDVGSYFTLTDSSASLVTDEVLAVLGFTGLRWIKDAAGGVASVTGTSVDNTDPSNPIVKAVNGWTRVDVPSNAQDKDITFDGESAYMIEVLGVVNNAAGNGVITILPNGNAPNSDQSYQEIGGATSSAQVDAGADMTVCGLSNAGKSFFHFWMLTKKGTRRYYHGMYNYQNSSNAIVAHYDVSGMWTDTTTDITKITLHASLSNGLGAGTFFLWRALPLGA